MRRDRDRSSARRRQSLWLADGTNYAGQDDLRARRGACSDALSRLYAALPDGQELLVEYKLFEPAFYATDIADWGSAVLLCQGLGDRAPACSSTSAITLQGVNVEQIVALLADEERLGGFHFNNRKYADDDLIVGSVNPFELFLIFCELVERRPAAAATDDRSVAQRRAKVEAMVLSVVNLQEAYAKALLVDRSALAERQQEGDVLGGHECCSTPTTPTCGRCARRSAHGAARPPIRWRSSERRATRSGGRRAFGRSRARGRPE